MKWGLFFLSLMTIVPGACQEGTTIGSAALLFKRWQVYQTREANSSAWTLQQPGVYYDVEYHQDETA